MYSNNAVSFHESTTILNAFAKKSGNLLNSLSVLDIYDLVFVWFYGISTIVSYLIRNSFLYISSSSSPPRAASKDIPDPLYPLLPIVHRFWQVPRATSRIITELLYVGSSWSSCFCSAIWGGPYTYKQFYLKLFCLAQERTLVLFDPYIGLYQVLPPRARAELGVMAIKCYDAFPKATSLLEPHHQIV